MNEPPITDAPSSGLNRRAALKKVAVGGAIAWTAPTLLSSTASAVEIIGNGCTAKCAPNLVVTVGDAVSFVCGSLGDWARIEVTVDPGGSCPCADTGTVVPNLASSEVLEGSGEIFQIVGTVDANRFLVVITGAGGATLENGSYTVGIAFDVTCRDRDLDVLTSVCTAEIDFDFSPTETATCSDPVGDAALALDGISCGTPVC